MTTKENRRHKQRIPVIFGMTVLLLLLLSARMVYVQGIKSDYYRQVAWAQWNRGITVPSYRGEIFDRNQKLLVGNIDTADILIRPARVEQISETARLLAEILEIEPAQVAEKLQEEQQTFYLSRRISAEKGEAVAELKLPGIYVTPSSDRIYPNGRLAAQLLGISGIDQGLSGLEYFYDGELQGQEGRIYFTADNLGEEIPGSIRQIIPPQKGHDIILTIDETIQFIVEREIALALEDTGAERVMALVADPETGEILAAASKPDFDPGNLAGSSQEQWNLLPFNSTFEPGSTFKLTTLLAMMEEDLFLETKKIFCDGSVEVAGRVINCWEAHGELTYLEALGQSCNTAFIAMGQELGEEKLLYYINLLGYGKKTGVDFPAEAAGLIFSDDSMGPVELATSAFGQGVSVTALQQVMAASAIANGGKLMRPYLVTEIRDRENNTVSRQEPEVVRHPISAETAARAAAIMETAITDGIASTANIQGYRVAGKSGTAQKVDAAGGYASRDYLLSFIGFAPVEDPQVVVYVAIDGAKKGVLSGSQLAAPVFRRITEDVLKYLQIPPSQSLEYSGSGQPE